MKINCYDLSLEIDFETLEIVGHETITLVAPETDLVLDASGIVIESILDSHATSLEFVQDHKTNKLIIRNVSGLVSGASREFKIFIKYHSRVADESLHGIYKSRYDDGYLIATDFEPNGARLLFPCIDDPNFKAEFNLQVTTQKDLIVTSNCSEREVVVVDEKRVKHVFERTPRMSTYLFYLGIGNFESSSLVEKGVEFRALARPGYARKGIYAIEHAAKFLKLYEEYYLIPYPLPKLRLDSAPRVQCGRHGELGSDNLQGGRNARR